MWLGQTQTRWACSAREASKGLGILDVAIIVVLYYLDSDGEGTD